MGKFKNYLKELSQIDKMDQIDNDIKDRDQRLDGYHMDMEELNKKETGISYYDTPEEQSDWLRKQRQNQKDDANWGQMNVVKGDDRGL